jgi:pyruvate dehydrogenase E2 component (dihydrolipoyllysine-residue acetyltransferase)
MATKVHMEALSPTMEEGQLVSWLKQEGDTVQEGDVLAEIETDKATMELVARGSGVLRKQLLAQGGTAPVGAVIGVVADPDEDISAILRQAGSTAGAAGTQAAEGVDAEPARAAEAQPVQAAEAGTGATAQTGAALQASRATAATPAAGQGSGAQSGDGRDGRVKASPLARRLAAEANLALGRLTGSGPGGRIIKRDIEAALQQGAAPVLAPAPAAAPAPLGPAGPGASPGPQVEEVLEVPVSQMRKTIAKRLVTSIGPVPTFYLTIEVDMTRMLAVRKNLNARLEAQGVKVSINDLIIKAVAAALRQHPEINASWAETVIRRYGRVHVGVAVAVEDGLITPVIHDADAKGVAQIATEVAALAQRARQKKLQPEEYTGATFSVSNLGMFGIDEFTAIINPPESGIIAVGRVEEKPVVVDGQVVVQARIRMTMSCDHRVVDGATGARFLQTLRDYLEEPVMMLA